MDHSWVTDMDQKSFFLEMVLNLSSVLEQVIGLQDAEGYLALVGKKVGHDIYESQKANNDDGNIPIERLSEILVELKSRIRGGFSIESIEDGKITLVNTDCPFGPRVAGHESLCMMTSSVFGTISAEAFGHANVDIQQSIATGHGGCRVVVNLNDLSAPGRNYFKAT
jgi:predicted ArsR family transcriptional regulator